MNAYLDQKLQAIIAAMPGWQAEKLTARPLVGGLMNSNWLINHDGRDYFMKLFGEGSDDFVDRRLSYEAARQAHALGISPGIALFDPAIGVEIAEFLQGYRASTNADFSRRDFLENVIGLYRRFNSCEKLSATKDVFAMTDEHIEQGRELGALVPADFDWLLVQYERAKAAFMASGLDLAPCHNDPMPGNFMVAMTADGRIGDMKLIDFEFASNNERAYEIGVFLGEVFVDEATSNELIEHYYGTARRDLVARVWVARAVADMKWGSWAVQQRQRSTWDFDFQKYGIWKYARARRLFDDPRWNDWLAADLNHKRGGDSMAHVTDDLVRLYAESDGLALGELVRSRQVKASEIAETAIHLVERLNPALNAVVIKTFDLARQLAEAPTGGPFAGVPYLLKNLGTMWKDTPLTFGTPYLKDFVCPVDSEIVRKVKASGLVPVGRSNTPEYGWCITSEPRMYGATVNPWNPEITAGGSSGGSAAAVAARIVPIADASDGGGSIRVPASCCGVVGLKPSRGRLSYGPHEAEMWFGCIYFLCNTRTVRDTAAYLDAVSGNLPGDAYHAPKPEKGWLAALSDRPRKLRIGYTLSNPFGAPLAPEVKREVEAAVKLFESLGHSVEEYDMKTDLEAAWWRYNDIIAVETFSEFAQHAKFTGRPPNEEDLQPFNWSMLEYAKTLSATQYSASIGAVRKAGQNIGAELAAFDVFVSPTLTQPPRPVGYWSMEDGDRERYLARWSDAAFMFAHNISGLPAMSVPLGMAEGNRPVGIQLVGRHGEEATLLRLAAEAEEAQPWIGRRPQICAI